MSIGNKVKSIADLACIQLTNEESDTYQAHFDKILEYFQSLNELDTVGIKPMITPHNLQSPLREDQVNRDLTVEQLLENAPEVKDSLFKVPPVV